MLRLHEIKLPLDHDAGALLAAVTERLGAAPLHHQIIRRGHDARKKSAIQLVYTVDATVADEAAILARGQPPIRPAPDMHYRFVAEAPPALTERPVVVGTGPCGLFAALLLAQMGFRPIIIERGQPVRIRTRDTWGLWRGGQLKPESNVQFGEGGAGTFSDGKLYSQIRDPLLHGRKVLTEFVKAGAPDDILFVAKPHIGTFRLVTVVERMRAEIEALGGEYRFGTRMEEVLLDEARHVRGLRLSDGSTLPARHVVLALGHSARDSFAMLQAAGVAMEAKALSIGVRIEHPQAIIDAARFGPAAGHAMLGAADYKLVHHAGNGRAVYSFCMCPGGRVVAAASEPGRLVTNGMSQYSRAEFNANAGIVVGVTPADFPETGPLGGIAFQRHWESRAFLAGGSNYAAPAQRVGDFLANRASVTLGTVTPSYQPGVTPTDLALCLPDYAVQAIREALPAFGRQLRGFAMDDAVMTGVETRTSSPLRVGRTDRCESSNTPGLYPAGEGAGYAGGILSAGIDGIRVAEALACNLLGTTLPPDRRRGGTVTDGWG